MMHSDYHTLSSSSTFLIKFVVPAGSSVVLGVGIFLMLLSPHAWQPPLDAHDKWTFFAVAVVGCVFVWVLCLPLKQIGIDDTTLYVSNYAKVISVPLTEVVAVTTAWWFGPPVVTIELRTATDFGSTVEFVPDFRWGALFGQPEVAQEIRDAVARANGQRPGGFAA